MKRMQFWLCLFIPLLTSAWNSAAFEIQPDTLYFKKFGPDWPKQVHETSGLLFSHGLVWTHNDSGNKPYLYGLKPGSWTIKSKLRLKGVSNLDWEDIALGPDGFYIGDFGDNRGKRDVRTILFLPLPVKVKSCQRIWPKTSRFTFSGEMFEDPPGNRHNRDMEAMTWMGDRMMLFTKNRKDFMSYVFEMKDFPPDTSLKPIGVIQAGGLVTGADYKEDIDLLLLVGYANFRSFLYMAPGFLESGMDSDKGKRIILQGLDGSQVEGITWIGEDSVLISTERTAVFNQSAFLIPINHLAVQPQIDTELMLDTEIFARHASWIGTGMIESLIHARCQGPAKIEILTFDGEILALRDIQLSKGDTLLSFSQLERPKRGPVFLRITSGQEIWSTLIQDL